MRTVPAEFARLAKSFDAGVATRVRTIRKSDGWEVDLTDLCDANWVRGMKYAEGSDNNTVSFSVDLVRSIGENTLNPMRTSKANRNGTTAEPVLALNRIIVVDVQVLPPDGMADANNWLELVRGTIDRIKMNGEANTITLECRDESARFIRAWQEYERNWPATIPDALEDVLQDLLDTATYDPGSWIPGVTRVSGDLVRPTVHNGWLYSIAVGDGGVSGATEPTSWDTTPGNTVADGTATWTNVGPLPAAEWGASGSGVEVRVGELTVTDDRNGYLYQCVVAGTKGGPTPSWGTTYGSLTPDNDVLWKLIDDAPYRYVPTSPSWMVTRAQADDYGLPPQSYWDIIRAFVDQIGWDFRWRWVDASSMRRPCLLPATESTAVYNSNGNLGTYTADQYEVTGDVEVIGEHIRNIVEVVYANGDETGDRKQTRLRIQDSASIAAYGPQFCQLTMDSAGLINTAAEALKLATIVLGALSRPVVSLSVRVPFAPWAQINDGLKLLPRPEDALLGVTATSDGTFVVCVEGVSHNTNEGVGTTELQLRGFFEAGADDIQGPKPLVITGILNREARARIGKTPTIKRPGDVMATIFANVDQGPSSAGAKPGLVVAFGGVTRDTGNNVVAGQFVAPVTGLYAITATVAINPAPSAGTEMILSVYSGSNVHFQQTHPVGTAEAGFRAAITASGLARLEAGDVPVAAVACDPSSTITIEANDTIMTVQLVR